MRTMADAYRAISVLVLVILATAALVQGVAAVDWTIEAYAGNNGAISPSGTIIVSEGNDQLFTLTPDPGYMVSDLIVDGSTVGAVQEYRFTNVVSNHTISAAFVRTAYTIDASAGRGWDHIPVREYYGHSRKITDLYHQPKSRLSHRRCPCRWGHGGKRIELSFYGCSVKSCYSSLIFTRSRFVLHQFSTAKSRYLPR